MPQVGKTLGLLSATGCAIAALTACTSPGQAAPTPAAPAPTGSATVAGLSSAAPAPTGSAKTDAGASARPTTAQPTTAQPSTARPTGEPDTDRDAVDWKTVAFDALRCRTNSSVPDQAQVDTVTHADLTGDGTAEAIVAASCRTTTATNPVQVFVFDGARSTAPLKRLLVIGKGQYLRNAELTTKGRTLTVTSEALSDTAPRCCADLRITQRYSWNGSAFTRDGIDETKL